MTEEKRPSEQDHGWYCTCGNCPDPERKERALRWYVRWFLPPRARTDESP